MGPLVPLPFSLTPVAVLGTSHVIGLSFASYPYHACPLYPFPLLLIIATLNFYSHVHIVIRTLQLLAFSFILDVFPEVPAAPNPLKTDLSLDSEDG